MPLSYLSAAPIEQMDELTNLEQMGAFCSSQIHDLNNQMACFCTTELFLETCAEDVPESLRGVLTGLCASIQRLSGTVEAFNAARRLIPLQKTWIDYDEVVEIIRGVLVGEPDWFFQYALDDFGKVRAETRWLGFVLQQLIGSFATDSGTVTVSRGHLPHRNYVRAATGPASDLYLLLHFENDDADQPTASISLGGQNYSVALELIRLMGASISFGRTDQPEDVLLALRLQD